MVQGRICGEKRCFICLRIDAAGSAGFRAGSNAGGIINE